MEIQQILNVMAFFSPEVRLTADLNHYFNFDHNTYLLGSSIDRTWLVSCDNQLRSMFTFTSANETDNGVQRRRSVNEVNKIFSKSYNVLQTYKVSLSTVVHINSSN